VAPPGWVEPTLAGCQSIEYRKHLPFYNRDDWVAVVKETKGAKPIGRYRHLPGNSLSYDEIRGLELRCALQGQAIPDKIGASWIKIEEVIGANDGIETEFIFVQLESNGFYHGYPITREQLRKKVCHGTN
jgi:hypothetical protein